MTRNEQDAARENHGPRYRRMGYSGGSSVALPVAVEPTDSPSMVARYECAVKGTGLQPIRLPTGIVSLHPVPQNDWGVCGNPQSARSGLLTFEHQGCPEFEQEKLGILAKLPQQSASNSQ
jgi:hypothetical protein